MSNYRESISRTLHGSLEQTHEYESKLDRLTAFSMSPRLGSLLWRLNYDQDSTAWNPAIEALANELKPPCKPMLAELALYEWLIGNQCPKCQGRGEMALDNGVVIKCESCIGTGRKRASDRSRATYMRTSIATAKGSSKTLEALHDLIGTYDCEVSRIMNAKLPKG